MAEFYNGSCNRECIFSSGSHSLTSEQFEAYPISLGGNDGVGSVPGLDCYEFGDYFDLDRSDPIQQQFYQINSGIMDVFADGLIQELEQMDEMFLVDQSNTPVSSSSLQSFSNGSQENSSPLLRTASTATVEQAALPTLALDPREKMKIQADNRYGHPRFSTPSSDDLVMARAMMAVISSSSSSSPSMLYQPVQQAQTQETNTNGQFSGFKGYKPDLSSKIEPKDSCNQKMIKKSLSLLRNMDLKGDNRTEESQSTGIQLQHIISERKRREKLNESFHELRSVLPSGTKKDKTSVLTYTKNYLNSLKSQIAKLEEENRIMDLHLLPHAETDKVDCSGEKVKIQIIDRIKLTSGLQQIELDIQVMRECDMIELVLHILECMKGMRFASLVSFDVDICSPKMDVFLQAVVKLQIKDNVWDEALFKETISRAVDGVC